MVVATGLDVATGCVVETGVAVVTGVFVMTGITVVLVGCRVGTDSTCCGDGLLPTGTMKDGVKLGT
jgi:hypothetical protein